MPNAAQEPAEPAADGENERGADVVEVDELIGEDVNNGNNAAAQGMLKHRLW